MKHPGLLRDYLELMKQEGSFTLVEPLYMLLDRLEALENEILRMESMIQEFQIKKEQKEA